MENTEVNIKNWKSLIKPGKIHQEKYFVLKRGFQSGLSKKKVSNLFYNKAQIKPSSELIIKYISTDGEKKGSEIKSYSKILKLKDITQGEDIEIVIISTFHKITSN